MDIRLKTADFELGGKSYKICCNMNVLADVQEALGGDLGNAMNTQAKTLLTWLAAMLNEANDISGDPERFTAKELGRLLTPASIGAVSEIVFSLVVSAVRGESAPGDESGDESGGEESKNVDTTQGL